MSFSKLINYVLFSVIIALSMPLSAIFNCGQKFINRHHPNHELIFLHDYHGDIVTTTEQLDSLIAYAQATQRQNSIDGDDPQKVATPLIVAEDFMGVPSSDPAVAAFIREWQAAPRNSDDKMGGMFGLVDKVRRSGLDSESPDFRHFIIMCVSDTNVPFTKKQVHDELMAQVHAIGTYNDGPVLNTIYQQKLARFHGDNKILLSLLADPITPLEVIRKKMNVSLSMEADLINANILHAIHRNRHRNLVVVCCGGDHLEEITPALAQLGYQLEKTVGATAADFKVHVLESGQGTLDGNPEQDHQLLVSINDHIMKNPIAIRELFKPSYLGYSHRVALQTLASSSSSSSSTSSTYVPNRSTLRTHTSSSSSSSSSTTGWFAKPGRKKPLEIKQN